MNRIAWFIEVLCLLMFSTVSRSSGQINNAPKQPYRILLDDVLSEKPLNYSQLFSNCQFIPLETNENCLINNLADIKIENNVIYILDRQMFSGRVLMFSITGQYLSKVDKTGIGPDEYTRFTNYDIDQHKKQIAIFDRSKKKLNFYDFQGNFKNELLFNNSYSAFTLNKNQIFLYKDPLNANDYILHIQDFSSNSLVKLLKSSRTSILDGSYVKVGSVNFYKYGDDVRFLPSFSDTLYAIKNQIIEPFLIIESKKYKLSDNDFLMINNDLRNRAGASSPPLISIIEKFTNFDNYAENDELIFFKFKLGMRFYFTFYDKISGKTICSSWLKDDLTSVNPIVITIIGDKLIAYISPSRFSHLKKEMTLGKIKVSSENKEILSEISEFDNPVIVILTINKNTMFQ